MTRVGLGIGCDRGVSLETLEAAVDAALAAANLGRGAVAAIASIDKKADETSILALAERRQWPLSFFGAAALSRVKVPNPSETVRRHMGTPAVAEAAALLVASATISDLLIEKYKHRGNDGKNVTVSVARVTDPVDPADRNPTPT